MDILENITKDEIIETAGKKIDVPYLHVGLSALGRTPIITVCLKPKEDWAHGIMQNEHHAWWNIDEDGTVENWGKFTNSFPKHRKFKAKSIEDAMIRINTYIQAVKVLLD